MGNNTRSVITVAHADDHLLLSATMADNMRLYPHITMVLHAPNGRELINALKCSITLPDIVLLDIKMKEMDGFETAAYTKKKWPQIKIIALTGFDTEYHLFNMIKCGASAFLSKRSPPEELVKAIEMVMDNQIYNTELFTGGREEQQLEFCGIETLLLQHAHEELTIEELAAHLGFKYKTVEARLSKLYEKIGVKGRLGLLLFAIKNGFVSPYSS
jgi:two-component system invasion response regulator UvrY